MGDVVSMSPAPKEHLRCPGIGRDAENDRSLVLYLNRPATDDEMRFLHDVLQRAVTLAGRCARSGDDLADVGVYGHHSLSGNRFVPRSSVRRAREVLADEAARAKVREVIADEAARAKVREGRDE